MKKEYTMKFNARACSWDPVQIRAGLRIGGDDSTEFMPLFPDFTVEDSPDISYGVGGIKEGILSITGKKIDKDGKTAEFYVSIRPPQNAHERDRMVKIIGDQMGFELKVTLNPVTGFFPGAPLPVVNTMVKNTSGTITVFLTLPPDIIKAEPEDDPILFETRLDDVISITPTCERINFSTLQYEVIRDSTGKPVNPVVRTRFHIKEEKCPLKIKWEKKDDFFVGNISPVRFQVGDGTPINVYEIDFNKPPPIEKTEPKILTKRVQCTTNPLEVEFRVIKGEKEIYREIKTVCGDCLNVSVVIKDSNMDWTNTRLLYQVRNGGDFFNKSHYDTGKFSLEESRDLEINIIKNAEDASTADSITLEIEEQPFSGIIHVYKRGWKLLDEDLAVLLPDAGGSLQERLSGATLEVTAKAVFNSPGGRVSINTEDIIIHDVSGRVITQEEEIAGEQKNGVLAFQMPGEPVEGKIVRLEAELSPDEYVRETLEGIYSKAYGMDAGLDRDIGYFGKGIISFLARVTEEEVKNSINGLYDKLGLSEVFFTKCLVMTKYLEFSYKLRDSAAKRIFDDFVSLLMELAFLFIEWGISQGSAVNIESNTLQKRILEQTDVKRTLAAKSAVLKSDIKSVGGKIPDIEKQLIQMGQELETSKAFLKIFEKELAKNPTKSLQGLTKRWGEKVILQEAGVKAMPKKIAKYKQEISNLEMKLSKVAKDQDIFKEEFQVLLKEMRGEIGIAYTTGKTAAGETSKWIFSYENVSENLSKLSEQLSQAFFEYIDTWEQRFKAEDNVSPVISEVYRTRYANYMSKDRITLENETSEKTAKLLSGSGIVSLVKKGEKPPQNWHETQWREWSKMEQEQRRNFEDHIRNLARDYLRADTDSAEWITSINPDSFKTVCESIDQLVLIMKKYEMAFSEGFFVDPTNVATWQDVDNLINMMSFISSALAKVVAGVTLLTGYGAPIALVLSKIGDVIDLLGAGTQVIIAAFFTMPETNGLAEAVPLLTSMLHNGLSETDVVFEEKIIKS